MGSGDGVGQAGWGKGAGRGAVTGLHVPRGKAWGLSGFKAQQMSGVQRWGA